MFERFSDRARRVVVLAHEEARLLDHNYIGTEHILLGLIHEGGGVAARALQELGISLESMREQVEQAAGRGSTRPSGHIPFTPRVKKVLELSLREALHLGQNYIGTGHLLLGVVREEEGPAKSGVAAKVLVGLGTDLTQVRRQVIAQLREPSDEGPLLGEASADVVLGEPQAQAPLLGESPAQGPLGEPAAQGPLGEPAAQGPLLGESPAQGPLLGRPTTGSQPLQTSGPAPAPRYPVPDILGALASITDRLTAIERRLGIPGSAAPAVNYDEQIEMVRSTKVAAIKAQDFEKAAILRDQEKELTAQKEAAGKEPEPPADVVSVVDDLARLRGQVTRLQGLLRRHGIDPEEPAASAE
jgi:Clp amino terminal domain, pathogenicity island component/UvrB/uvrC motif